MCCGGKKKVDVVIDIALSNYSLFFDSVFGSNKRCDINKISICKLCENSTYLTKYEYIKWLIENGVKILRNIENLETLPLLEKHEYKKNCLMFCRICKCWIPAKVYSKNKKCPLNKW